jgi:hypothetical protein
MKKNKKHFFEEAQAADINKLMITRKNELLSGYKELNYSISNNFKENYPAKSKILREIKAIIDSIQ